MYSDLVKNKTFYSLEIPKTIVPVPTSNDYESSFIERYFIQKANDVNGFVYEIDINEFTRIKSNPYWLSTIISWRISGPLNEVYNDNGILIDKGVINSNKATLATASAKLKNIGLYLPNVLQFHK
jgi:uncharacterized protein with ACT and thioredoxin-like domain